ncbi:MAG: DMT family transporter [Candidatus Neomarinimicrobiota bacterium]|nr:MAG: DMT family transporter [Candidatus Neomarinimicrobiota bacterium]
MKKYFPALAVIFAAVLWSLDGFLRQELYSLPAIAIVTLEHLIGALVLLPFLFRGAQQIRALNQRGWVSVFWISIAGGLLGTFFYTKALSYVNYIDLSIVVLLQKFQPLFAIALAAVILKEPFTRRYLLLALMAVVGGYFVTFGLQPITHASDKTLIAALLALLAAFSWGSSTVLGKHALKRLTFPVVTALRQTITAVIALVVLTSLYPSWEIGSISTRQWMFLLIIVFSTGSAALFIYYYGLNHLPASHTTLYELFWPLSAVALDYLVRHRPLSTAQLIGGVVLLTAIILLPREQPDNA